MHSHVIVKWNPYEDFEPHTIVVHARLLSEQPGFCWWGKMEKTSPNLRFQSHTNKLNKQIQQGIETHLYLHCPYGPRTTLHVAKVERICKASERDHKNLTPDYYRRLPLRVRYWFKISDIRRLQPDPRDYLLAYDPVSVAIFPRLVKEKEGYQFFDYSITRGRRWYVIQSLDAMLRMPGELEELTDV